MRETEPSSESPVINDRRNILQPQQEPEASINSPELRADKYEDVKRFLDAHPNIVDEVIDLFEITPKDPILNDNVLSYLLNCKRYALRVARLLETIPPH